MSPKENDIREC